MSARNNASRNKGRFFTSGTRRGVSSRGKRRRSIRGVMHSRQQPNGKWLAGKSQAKRKPIQLIGARRLKPEHSLLFEHAEGHANEKGRNLATAAAGRIDGRGIRDRVDRGDKQQEADDGDEISTVQTRTKEERSSRAACSQPLHKDTTNSCKNLENFLTN